MKNFYLPASDNARVTWLNNFAGKLPSIAAKFGILGAQTASTQADATFFDALIKYKNQQETFISSIIAYKNAMRDGLKSNSSLAPLVPPAATLPAVTVGPDIFGRVSELVKKIKASQVYSPADGRNLGIEGSEIEIETSNAKPVITLAKTAGHTRIEWVRRHFTSIEIQKDRGDGNWRLLAIDTVPDYVDTEELPAGTTYATWRYRARYRKGDDPVGEWSDVVFTTITAG